MTLSHRNYLGKDETIAPVKLLSSFAADGTFPTRSRSAPKPRCISDVRGSGQGAVLSHSASPSVMFSWSPRRQSRSTQVHNGVTEVKTMKTFRVTIHGTRVWSWCRSEEQALNLAHQKSRLTGKPTPVVQMWQVYRVVGRWTPGVGRSTWSNPSDSRT
jgi:hypothetical protein